MGCCYWLTAASADDNSVRADTGHRQFRIKLQKFEGTGSWETWWAHFKNCASYNRWTERDKLAFMKGALTGNAAQVLWDTARVITGSWKKQVDLLKTRYSGERQAKNIALNYKLGAEDIMRAFRTPSGYTQTDGACIS